MAVRTRRAKPVARDEQAAAHSSAAIAATHESSSDATTRTGVRDVRSLMLQQTVGNAAVQRLLRGHVGASGSRPGLIQRDGPPTKDPSTAETTKPAKPEEVAKDLLKHYAGKYLGNLEEEAKKRLAQAWSESPGGVIAAGAIIGAAGVSYLIGTKSELPKLPAIPLDFIGGPFQNATIELQMTGPVTSPEGFSFKITFKGQEAQKRKPADAALPPNIYSYANPEAIAKEVDGPEFETQIPDAGPDSNLRNNLANIVRITGNAMLAAAQKKDLRPYVDLGELPPTPPTFVDGLKRIVDALIAAAPTTLGKIEQVNFRAYKNGNLRFIPVRPSAPPAPGPEPTPAP